MQKLRSLYAETQRNANSNFEKVTPDRLKKICAYANKEYEVILQRNDDFSDLDEVAFYRQKFQEVERVLNEAVIQGDKRPKLQTRVKQILREQFHVQGSPPPPEISPGPENLLNLAIKSTLSGKSNQNYRDPKVQITNFFDNKKDEIQKSKLGFRSIMEERPHTVRKFAVKASEIKEMKVGNNQSILRMQKEMDDLRNNMGSKLAEKDIHTEQVYNQNKHYAHRIQFLEQQIDRLKRDNQILKEKSERSEINHYTPPPTEYRYYDKEEEDSAHYKIKYKFNNLGKIKDKDSSNRERSVHDHKPNDYRLKEEQLVNRSISSEDFDIMQQLKINRVQSPLPSFPSNLKFDREEVEDEGRNVAARAKISFFKPSVVIYRSKSCEVALKSFEVINQERQKIIIYVNNKQETDQSVHIAYKLDSNYYRLDVLKKLEHIDYGRQGREEIQVTLLNQFDMDSVIEARLTINSVEINFLVPAMFIEFTQKQPLQKTAHIERYSVKTIYQFSTIDAAEELIPFEKQYGYGAAYDTAKIYAESKYQEGYIVMRWKKVGVVEIETIRPWKLFLSYLLCRDF